jgi:preprotein translocase SecF subunit
MALIRWVPIRPNLTLIAWRRAMLAASLLIVAAAVLLFAVRGLNFGVDFRGGILMEVRMEQRADLAELRNTLGGLGLGEVTLQRFGEPTDVLINIQKQEGGEAAQAQAIEKVKRALGERVESYRRTEFVGPKVGEELKQAGIIATLLALGAIGLYVWFRFEWQFGAAALAALLHDVIGMIGFFALTQLEFNLGTVAAVLTIAGYSINDTVVIFDRVRETMRRYRRKAMPELLDLAINSTISRTVLTSATTLAALIALALFGGEVIRGFSYGLIFGVLIGTYSSVGVAVPLLLYMGVRPAALAKEKETEKAAASRIVGKQS